MRRLILSCLMLAVLSSCTSQRFPERPEEDNLTEEFARFRASQVKAVSYDLHFDLKAKSETFSAQAKINVDLTRRDAPLSLDFKWKEIRSVLANGQPVKRWKEHKGSLEIPPHALTSNKVAIVIDYVSEFSKTGDGFLRVVDQEDSSEYLYTDFEPYQAHQLFPCFDQPDLKATYRVTVDAPQEWKVIANSLEDSIQKLEGGRKRVAFKNSLKFSPYLMFLGAGPFTEWTDKYTGKHNEVPLTLYSRKALAKHVDSKNLFSLTKKGLAYFESYFGVPYPFPKYGQLFIPEFAWGGMENPGAVTLNERSIFRGPVTKDVISNRANLIFHEMAHMWFGDLVTMKWWNDLWLNESFATFMASLCEAEVLGPSPTWESFFAGKTWGYWQDTLVTTHPIETQVLDTVTSRSNFDGITYAKGAAALKQLNFFVGADKFREGVRSYFKKFAWSNAIRADFVNEIGAAAETDLSKWTQAWLKTAGPNRVVADWKCDAGKVTSFAIRQSASVSGALSPHRTKVALFKRGAGDSLAIERVEEVAYSSEVTPVNRLVGMPCPAFVYPNFEDHDYALFELDPVSTEVAKRELPRLPDPLLRLMTLHTLSDMVKAIKLTPEDYFSMAIAELGSEKAEGTLGILLGRRSPIRSAYVYFLTREQRVELAPLMESVVWKRFQTAPQGGNEQLSFFDFYTGVARSRPAQRTLESKLKDDSILAGVPLGQDRRWSILTRLISMGAPSPEALIEAESKRDPSDQGKRAAAGARAAISTLDNKKAQWDLITRDGALRPSVANYAGGLFHNADRPELSLPFVEPYFDQVEKIDWAANEHRVELFFEQLFPISLCSRDVLAKSQESLDKAGKLNSPARRAWREANDQLDQCIRIREKAPKK